MTGTEAIRLAREDNAIIELPKIDNKFPLSYLSEVSNCQEELRQRKLKRDFSSNVFRPHYVGEIKKGNNHRSFCICVE